MNCIFKTGISVILLSCICTFASSCKLNRGEEKKIDRTVKVKVTEIVPSKVCTAKTYVGKVKSGSDIIIKTPFPGTVDCILVKQGQKVKKGEELAYIYSETVENSYSAAKATLHQAQDAYNRLNAVKGDGSVSEIKLIEVQTRLAQAQASFKSAEKARQDCHIKASREGTVGKIYIKDNEDITLFQALVRIVDLSDLEVEISVPETEIASLKTGETASVEIPAIPGAELSAHLENKGVNASAVSHNYTCTLRLTEYPSSLMPGMIGKVRFESFEDKTYHVIPTSAVCSDKDGRYVWLMGRDCKVEKRYVQTGDFASEGIIITSGLKDSDLLITDGIAKISTGMKVKAE